MADNTVLGAAVGTGDNISTDDLGTVKVQRVKVQHGADGSATDVSTASPLPAVLQTAQVADGGTLPTTGVQVGGTDGSVFQVISTDNAGRVNTNINGTVTTTGGLTDTQLRASAVPVDTELPAAAALADATTNPSTSVIGSMLLCYNGTTWDRARGDTTNGVFVNVKATAAPSSLPLPAGAATAAKQPALGTAGSASADVLSVQGVASMTALKVDGSAVTQPISGNVTNAGTFAVQIAANSSVNVAQVAGTATDVNSGTKSAGTQRVVLATDQPQLTNALKVDGSAVTQPISATNLSTNMAQVAGTTTSVNSGAKDAGTQRVILASDQTVVPVSDNAGSLTVDAPVGTPVFVTTTPSTTGGWSKITALAQTTTKKVVKASAGAFGGYFAFNPNTTAAYIQVFDLATGSVTLGTTAPDMVFCIPGTASGGVAANIEFTNGVNMANAITLACTTTATGSTAPGTGLDLTLFFK